jgi:hypothetical protein
MDPINFRPGVARPATSNQLAAAARSTEPSADRYEGGSRGTSLSPAVVAAAEGFVRGAGIGSMLSAGALVVDALQNPAHPMVGGKVVLGATLVGGAVGLTMAMVDHVRGKGQAD